MGRAYPLAAALVSACAAACSLLRDVESLGEGTAGDSTSSQTGVGGAGAGGAGGSSAGGGPTCPANTGDCDDQPGCEANLTNDAAHCGACDHSCGASPCTDGLCPPQLMVEGLDSHGDLALDATHVYWTDPSLGHVARAPLSGGDPEILCTGQAAPYDIALDDAFVYWANVGSGSGQADGAIARAPKSGGAAQVLADDIDPRDVALDGDRVLYLDAMTLRQVPKVGGAAVTLPTPGYHNFRQIAVGATFLFVADALEDGAILRIPSAGGPPVPLVVEEPGPWALVVDADNVFWTRRGHQEMDFVDGALRSVAIEGGPAATLLSPTTAPGWIALSAGHVYWSNGYNRLLQRIPSGGGAVLTLADTELVAAIAVDDTSVYWIDQATIRRVPK